MEVMIVVEDIRAMVGELLMNPYRFRDMAACLLAI